MTSKKTTLLCIGVMIVALIIFVLASNRNPGAGDLSSPENKSGQNPIGPTIKTDTDYSELSEAELEQMIREINEAEPIRHREEFSAFVPEGETLITDGFETSEGVFVFTGITPGVYGDPENGQIMMTMRRFGVTVGGDESILTAPKILMNSGTTAQIAISNAGEPNAEGWSLEIGADVVPGGFLIHGTNNTTVSSKE